MRYSAGEAPSTEFVVSWQDIDKPIPARGHQIYLLKKNRQKIGVWLSKEDMPGFLEQFFAAWGSADQERARKAAFDYGSSDHAVGWVWLLVTLLFPGLLAAMLLIDGLSTLSCTNQLETKGKITTAELVKIKKNRRSMFVWALEFTNEAGEKISGKRQAPVHDEKGAPIGGRPYVVYSPDTASCWDVSLKPGEKSLNVSQRRFTVQLDLSFGIAFAIVTLVCGTFSIARIRRRHPFREVALAYLK